MNPPRISLCLIAKNEEKFLAMCLASVVGAVDEINVLDTGSTDNTVAVAQAYGAKVALREWDGRFDSARNASLAMATGDWILSLDADERILMTHTHLIRKIVSEAPPDCQGIFCICVSGTPGMVDESPVLRLFRRLPHIKYEGRIHEEVGMAIQRAGGSLGQSQIVIVHEGYQAQIVEDRQKWDRNEKMLLLENEERPNSGFTTYNLGHAYLVMGWREEEDALNEALARRQEYQEKYKTRKSRNWRKLCLAVEAAERAVNEKRARPARYFAQSLALSSPANIYWSWLVEEARVCGVQGPALRHPCWPPDPVSLGFHPDPLARAA